MNCIVTDGGGAISKALALNGHAVESVNVLDYEGLKRAAERLKVVDCLIHTGYRESGNPSQEELEEALESYRLTVIPPMEAVRVLLPYMEESSVKRLVFLTSAKASVNLCRDTKSHAFYMAQTALHMRLKIMHNELASDGFQIKAIDPCAEEKPQTIARLACASGYVEKSDPSRNVDEQLILMDALGRCYPW